MLESLKSALRARLGILQLNQASNSDRTVEKLLRQQAALASFGAFAFRETNLAQILGEAARICASSLGVPFSKVCRYRAAENDLLIEAGCGWNPGVVGRVISQANESSPQGRTYVTGEPVIIRNLQEANNLELPSFYPEHGIISTIDVLIPATDGAAYGVLEIDSPTQHQYDVHDINFLTGFANVLAEAVATATRNQAIKELLEAKNLLAEELTHRVRNNLQVVTGMLSGFSHSSMDESARQGLGEIVRRVTTFAQVYDSLLGIGLSRTIDLADYLTALCASLPELQVTRSQRVNVVCYTEPVLLGIDKVTVIGMVVAELVSNSFGHAFPGREGTVTVKLTRSGGTKEAILTVQDDGVGFEIAAGSRHGLGLVRRLVEQAKGTLVMHSGDGTLWTMKFPIYELASKLKPAA